MRVERVWTRARIATLDPNRPGLRIIEDGAVATREGRICWVGPVAETPALDAVERFDLAGRWITPGLVDCHTHLVYGGNRAHEFELRLRGASYEEIARAGGGIVSTVKATRAASQEDLVASAPDLSRELVNAIMDALAAHSTMSTQALGSQKVQDGLKEVLLGPAELYEALRARAAAIQKRSTP